MPVMVNIQWRSGVLQLAGPVDMGQFVSERFFHHVFIDFVIKFAVRDLKDMKLFFGNVQFPYKVGNPDATFAPQ